MNWEHFAIGLMGGAGIGAIVSSALHMKDGDPSSMAVAFLGTAVLAFAAGLWK